MTALTPDPANMPDVRLTDDPELCSLCGGVKHYHGCGECGGCGHIGKQRCNFCRGFGWFRDCINPACKAYSKIADMDFANELKAAQQPPATTVKDTQ